MHPDAEADEVWYLDGMTKKQLTMILDGYGELLCQDGLSAFAIGSLTTEEELFVQKYKVLSIYSETVERFEPLLRQFDVEKTPNLVTAWDTFSEAHPGSAERLEVARPDHPRHDPRAVQDRYVQRVTVAKRRSKKPGPALLYLIRETGPGFVIFFFAEKTTSPE